MRCGANLWIGARMRSRSGLIRRLFALAWSDFLRCVPALLPYLRAVLASVVELNHSIPHNRPPPRVCEARKLVDPLRGRLYPALGSSEPCRRYQPNARIAGATNYGMKTGHRYIVMNVVAGDRQCGPTTIKLPDWAERIPLICAALGQIRTEFIDRRQIAELFAVSSSRAGQLIHSMSPMLHGNSLVVEPDDVRKILSAVEKDKEIHDLRRRLAEKS